MNYYRDIYLKSEHWQNLRLSKLVQSKTKCALCAYESVSNDVHHITYKKDLHRIKKHHLRVLCRRCHKEVHRLLDEEPMLKKIEYHQRWSARHNIIKRMVEDDVAEKKFLKSEFFPLMLWGALNGFLWFVNFIVAGIIEEKRAVKRVHRKWRLFKARWGLLKLGCANAPKPCARASLMFPSDFPAFKEWCTPASAIREMIQWNRIEIEQDALS